MKIFFLTKYSQLGASSRYRTYQYLPYFSAEGISYNIQSLFSDEYLSLRYIKGRVPLPKLIKAFLNRILLSSRMIDYDLIVIEKELFPYLPFYLERFLLRKARAYTLDFDDALYHSYDQHSNPIIRHCFSTKFSNLFAKAALVTVANPYIANYARRYTNRIEYLPTVIDLNAYSVVAEPKNEFTIGWIGTPMTTKFLYDIIIPLKRFFKNHKGKLLLIGANDTFMIEGVKIEKQPWSIETEASLLQSINVGIMPLPNSALARGKSGLKLLQYMACGRAVIASPVGVNTDIVTPDVGLLANSEKEWLTSLTVLAKKSDLRNVMGINARRRVEEKYSLAHWAPLYTKLLRTVSGHIV